MINIVVPALGESITEAVLLRWLKEDGDHVAETEPIAELETDKTNVDIPAPAAGVLHRGRKVGESIKVSDVIGQVDEKAAGAKPVAKPAEASPKASVVATEAPAKPAPAIATAVKNDDLRPSVRRIVEENRLDASKIQPTGPGGRIVKEDALRAVEAKVETPKPAAPTSAPVTPAAGKPATPLINGSIEFDDKGVSRQPISKLRKRIAERLVHAQQTAAILTTFNEVDMSAIVALRAKYKERFTELHGVSLGFMSFFARAVVLALREFPRVNAFIDNENVVFHNYVNLGIAVSTDRGLTVPVLQNVQNMSFARIESEIKRLAFAARDGKLGINDLSGATFTITNGGVFGSLLSTPIISPPESGILGMHAIKDRPVAVSGKVEIRPMMYIALSYDHRLVDGRESVSFLVRLKDSLEDPSRLILEV
jgi:2-oxoglutarate dehydrogenase E2 component (dihydrolipoamide succinyltransferase)